MPLVNPQTNAAILNFPETPAAFVNLTCKLILAEAFTLLMRLIGPQKRTLGISLTMNDPGAQPSAAAKAIFVANLRIKIGLKARPV